MRILPVQHNYTNRYNSLIKAESNKQTCTENLQQADRQGSVNFCGLLYYLTKDKCFDVISTKNAERLVAKGLKDLNLYTDEEIAKAKDIILYMTRKNNSKHYRTVIQKILELAKEKIRIHDVLKFKDVNFTPYAFDNLANEILKVNKLGYPIDYMPKLLNSMIESISDIKKLVDLREESLKRKELLSYSYWQAEDEDVDDLLLSEPILTLNTLKFLGKKSFLATYEDKYDSVENHIVNLGHIDEDFPFYEKLIQLTNPTESKIYKGNQEKIADLKKLYQANKNDDIKNEINNLTKFNRNLVENAIKEAKDKTFAGYAACMFADEPMKLKYLLPTLNDNTKSGKRKRNKILNNSILSDSQGNIEKRIDFRRTKFLRELTCSDADFSERFNAIINTLLKHPSTSIKHILTHAEMNLETRKQFSRLGIDYENWVNFDPKSSIKKEIIIDTSSLKQHAIKNLEDDFNNELFTEIPPDECSKLIKAMEAKGYNLVEQTCAKCSNDGFFDSVDTKLKLYKNNSPVTFDDLPELMRIIKKEMTNSVFWQTKNKDKYIENARSTIKNHFLKLRNSEIKSANVPSIKENANLEVLKADMNDIEHSLFLGNYASCCTAIGSGSNQWTAPSYILCKLASAIEVKINQEYVGNTMCFIAKVDDKPALILDNIELQHKYQYNDEIRDSIFAYAKKIVAEIGQPNLPIYAFPNRHKVNMDGLDITKKEFCIVGSTGDWDIYLDFDASAHQISEDETFTSYLYKIS